ncbi:MULTISPECIES: hypothetical protein [unclassified Microcystis]|uniref:hypothetical protein n=1 Tax=unclassified Microcystis TaxID=2643300 RepID=UPI00258EC5DA|nr:MULTISPECIES: hypothetical protein [unclassified Microcystis]MCA2620244.1 hypothetical protein [Microcystis sp. M099S2]MCA2806863.1 hypothetical protein [Microcystis sp. M095S1]MCA2861823.1 hypothetical protein [Microcystis sp. M005S1]
MKRQPRSATTLKKWRGEESPSVLRRRGCQPNGLLYILIKLTVLALAVLLWFMVVSAPAV